MHDTTSHNAFFYAGTDAEFIKEYRIQLAALKMRVESDYDDMRVRLHAQARRIDSLEGLLPMVRMQQNNINDVTCDLRAMKRIVTDLQCDVAAQKNSPLGRFNAWIERILVALQS